MKTAWHDVPLFTRRRFQFLVEVYENFSSHRPVIHCDRHFFEHFIDGNKCGYRHEPERCDPSVITSDLMRR
jgi:hypothetical protein